MSSSLVIFYCVCLFINTNIIKGRNIPYYDLDDDFYSEIRSILADHMSEKITSKIPHPREVRGWGLNIALGQVSAVSVDCDGNPVVIHRGKRQWNRDSFNQTEHFQLATPIEEDVVVTLDQRTGDVMKAWGGGKFYMPHGLHIDDQCNVWITDVALHQVQKFPQNSEHPSLELGEKLIPGNDLKHFCKPTSVAVATTGDFFVADGYCNARILHFSSEGNLIGEYGYLGSANERGSLYVPHGIALQESKDMLCIADRENARIKCITAGLKDHKAFGNIVSNVLEPNRARIFDVAFMGNYLVGVSGSEAEGMAIGFTVEDGALIDQWSPIQGFHNPHSIATDPKTGTIYVSEIGPNRVWKMSLEGKEEAY